MHRFIVYQYGKVGSTSLVNALNTLPESQAFQSHFMGKDAFTATLARLQDPMLPEYFFEHSAGQLIENLRIFRHFSRRDISDDKLTIISVAREPFDWFRSCISQDIAQHLASFRATLQQKNITHTDDADVLEQGMTLLFRRLLQAIEYFGSVDALCQGKRYTLHKHINIPDPNDFKNFMFLLNIFLRPHTWFNSHLEKEMNCEIRTMAPLGSTALCHRQSWGNIYLLRYESLSEGFQLVLDDLEYSKEISLPHSNVSKHKPFSAELDAIFSLPEALELQVLCHSKDTKYLGYN